MTAVCITSGPLAPAQEPNGGGSLAIIGDRRIGLSDLPASARGQLIRLRSEEYQLLRRAADQKLDEILIELAAPRRSASDPPRLLELLAAEGLSPPPVTSGEVRVAYEVMKDRYPGLSPDEAFVKIQGEMEAHRLIASRQALLEKLRATAKISYLIHPPHIELETEGKPVQGPPNAPVTLVVVSDFECPFCAKASEAIRNVMKTHPGQVRLVFHHLPLNIHPFAFREAEASQCAALQGLFWPMHDELFRQQPRNDAALRKAAQTAGLNRDGYEACMEGGLVGDPIRRDMAEAESLGINATPTLLVNGSLISGGLDYQRISAAVNEALLGRAGVP